MLNNKVCHIVIFVTLLVIIPFLGCGNQSPIDSSLENPTEALSKNNVVHHVSVGGADICVDISVGLKPGCDGNFSLVANEKTDGSVGGQYTDQFGHGNGGFHATVNCLSVNGNEAWVSGVITSGNFQGFDLTGFPVITRVADNGTSGDQSGLCPS